NMRLVRDLCLLACLTTVTCDRVYVHPFNLFAFNKSTCEQLESLAQEGKKTFVPVSIESQTPPAYEDDLKVKLEGPSLSGQQSQELSVLERLVHTLLKRVYGKLQEVQQGQNLLLSPTGLYSSLVSFYLGASNQTAADVQTLMGFAPPSEDDDCTTRVDGYKILSNLRMFESLIKSKDEELLFSKMLCLFSAPGVPLSRLFVQDLLPSADALYARAVDFTNPSEAAKQINTFMEAKSKAQSKHLLTDIDPSANLLFALDISMAANLKQASRLSEPQEFQVDSNTKIFVPMLSVTGTFKYNTDASGTFSVVEIPISKTALLVLLHPINGSDLEHLESLSWLHQLSPREMKLTLPELRIESSYDLQEILADLGLPELLGKGADLSKISDTNLTVGKVINRTFFKLMGDGTAQPEESAAQKEDLALLELTLNKPFLFAIFEQKTRAMLLLGRVTNPLQG
ncbi:ANGT protein, partial [Turnix velox]|nr:ANGT protein [Turnix velox]